jgi:hypothetical protein
MPKKTKIEKPLPSALTVANPIAPRTGSPSPSQPRAVSTPKAQAKPLAPQARQATKTAAPSEPRTAPRKIASPIVKKSTTVEPATISFVLTNAHAGRVAVSGEFNHWSADATPMMSQGDGAWKTTLALPPGRHQYKFVVDGHWMPDPNASEQVADGYGAVNSVIEVRG